jgi:hypothetical protein
MVDRQSILVNIVGVKTEEYRRRGLTIRPVLKL